MFKKGDVVMLRSGGPAMTVQNVGDYSPHKSEDGVECVWFNEKRQLCNEVFDAAVLESAS